MKILLPIFLLILIISSSFIKTIIWVNYRLNFEFIKKELCVNKDNPKMNCNGKCYLSKQIKKAENNPLQLPQQLKDLKEPIWFISATKICCMFYYITIRYFTYTDTLNSLYKTQIDLPPKILFY